MDILNICPAAKDSIESFKHAVNSCTQYIRHKQSINSQSTPNFNIYHNNHNVNIIESDIQKPILHTDVATQTSSTSEANILITDQFYNTCLAIQLEEKQIIQCFNITQDQNITNKEGKAQKIDLLKFTSVEDTGTLKTEINAAEHIIELLPNTTPIKRKLIDFIEPQIKKDLPLNPQDYLDQLNTTLKQAYATVRTNNRIRIEKAQLNTKRVLAGCNFNVGDEVWYLNEKKKKNINKSLQNKFIGPYTIISILDNHINYIIKADNKKSKPITVHRSKLKKCISRIIEPKIKQKSITIVDHLLNNEKPSAKLKDQISKSQTLKLNNVEPSKKRGRPKKAKYISSTDIQSNSEIIITPINPLNTTQENTFLQSVSIVDTVQSPQNNIVLKQYPLRNKLNK